MDVQVGDILTMKKPHPCGGNQFQVLRIGMDFKIRCLTCGHEIMSPANRRARGRIGNVREIKRCRKPVSGDQPKPNGSGSHSE